MSDRFDTFSRIVHERHSVRVFLPDAVPDALLRESLALAQQAPSNCNTQSWVVHLVSGDPLERLRAALHGAVARGKPAVQDYPQHDGYRGVHRDRQIGSAKALYDALGIGREDRAERARAMLDNFRFFGAPHVAFVFLSELYGPREAADCGMFAQTLMLALAARGVGSCAQGAVAHHADIVRTELGVEGSQRLLFGIAIGREDTAQPANAARTDRAGLEEAIVFHA
ncbi:MAG TPA: nitroreductase family protein [Sphingobium sp.]